jgi:predicted Zn-dependent protease
MLRQHADDVSLPSTTPETTADLLMDRLVNANPNNVAARLTRYQYRARNSLPDAAGDLKVALEIEPNNVDAIVLSATSIGHGSANEAARSETESLLRRAIDAAPQDPRPYLILANMLAQSNKSEEVLELLRRARKATDDDFEILVVCANIQVSSNKLKDARQTLQELDAKLPTYLVPLKGEARLQVENRLRLLRARLDLAQDKHESAVSSLHEILLTLESKPAHQTSPEWKDACGLLALFHARSGEWDKASEYWGNLARALPADPLVARRTVDAYLKDGNAKAAIDTIDRFNRRAEPDADLAVQLVQAHLALQLNRSHTDQSWSEFDLALQAAKRAAANRVELVFAEASCLVANGNRTQAAIALLNASEKMFAGQVEFWRIAAGMYQELGDNESTQRALAKHQAQASAGEHALLQATLLVKEGKHREIDQLLTNLGQSPSSEERRRIEQLLVEALVASNDLAAAFQRVKHSVQANPRDAKLLMLGIDVAIAAGEMQTAEAWEMTLLEVTNNGPDATYLRALRLVESFNELDAAEKQNLGRLISKLRTDRPKWYAAVALSAQFSQLQRDWRRALADYRLAVDLGDRRTATLQQIITLLYRYGRFNEAQTYLSYLPATRISDRFFDNMAVELAVKQDDSAAALETAKQSVERAPNDPMRRITLASVLARYRRTEEGLDVLRAAARKFPQDSRVWLGLFSAYVQAGKPDEARSTLAALVKSSVLPEEQRYFVAAQGHEMLGNIDGAKKLYQLAVDKHPEETAIRLKYAKLLSKSDPKSARAHYERVLEQEPSNSEARRELSLLLAASGLDNDWARAQELLAAASGESISDAKTNDRLRAMLLSRKGRTRSERIANCRAAHDMLRRLIEAEGSEADDLNRILISQIIEQEAMLSDDRSLLIGARDQLRTVVNRTPTAEMLSIYIEFLLRHGGAEPAALATGSGSETADSDTSEQQEAFLSEAEAKLSEFHQIRSGGNAALEALSIAYKARMLQARGREAEAKAQIADFIARQTKPSQDPSTQAQRYLAIGKLYSSIGAHAEAESWYRRLIEFSPNGYVPVVQALLAQNKREEAIELCLSISKQKPTPEMATLIANVMTATHEPIDDSPEAQAAIESAMKDHSENIDLFHAEAVRRASRGQYDDAIAIFRRILAKDPNNVFVLNNFATVLAERPNQRGEALKHIGRAIEIAGRRASLLDTQGTIFLKIGEPRQAIACLEEATAGGASDARYYLHLAAAYQQAQRFDDAQRMLTEARAFGLEKFVLTADDRELLAAFDNELQSIAPSSGTSL